MNIINKHRTNDWYGLLDGVSPGRPKRTFNGAQKFVRGVVITWLGDNILPERDDLDVFEKCFYLFDVNNLEPFLREYCNCSAEKRKHWLDYIHTLSTELFCSFDVDEIGDIVSKYKIDGREFVIKVLCLSGLISFSRLMVESCLSKGVKVGNSEIKELLSQFGKHGAKIYECLTDEILVHPIIMRYCHDKEKFTQEILGYLEDKEIPLEFGHSLPGDSMSFEIKEEKLKEYRKKKKLWWLEKTQKYNIYI